MGSSSDTTGRLWVEPGEQRQGLVAEVAPLPPLWRTYTFAVPDELQAAVVPGRRVVVPLGRRGTLVDGFVLGLDQRAWDTTLRPIQAVRDTESYLTPELIELGRRIARHYLCPLGRTLKAMTPEAVRQQSGLLTVRCAALARPAGEWHAGGLRLTGPRRAILEALAQASSPVPVATLLERTGASTGVLQGLARAGWVSISTRKELPDNLDFDRLPREPDFTLNVHQERALEVVRGRLAGGGFSVTLLFGVSGSGKTEVYVHAIRAALAMGRQALLLVPEIVLTTQLVQRLAARFPQVAVQHSGLTDAQRSVIWREVAAGRKQVVIGTRSAVFAPCPRLGLICVDEEQDASYKNLQAPRFHVRDVAIMRGHLGGFPVVLGSATPSLESWHNSATRPHYERVTLPARVKDLPLPIVQVVDMNEEPTIDGQTPVLSRLLEHRLREALGRQEQAVILMNRRGYASRVYCPVCRARLVCPRCSVSLVVHTATGRALCHYCRTQTPIPTRCPTMGCGARLVQIGPGTQRIEDILASRFPEARICRVDSDTVRHRDEYQKVVDDFEARRTDVLVGTQMIAKGLDFPWVSVVGVINAEPSALAGDFRAQERLFQLLTQVAGRAGRAAVPGSVVVQTTMPDLYALSTATRHDYEAFVARELPIRRRVGLPPYRRLARFVLTHARDEQAVRCVEALAEHLRGTIAELAAADTDVLGPSPCPLPRLRGKYRYELLVRAPEAATLHRLLQAARDAGRLRITGATLMVDVDPVELA
ncbi:MAG TPA: primosomal protein N' [Phycisphaerae bacterium]|nr:primosomal protein N' [Phycisphaerae bacterium]HNU44879.1 primosomal protein N' [Phycisphaerae bacterium]